MKKVLFALVALICICSCKKEQMDVIYSISVGVSSFSISGPVPSEGRTVMKEYSDAIMQFSSKYSSDFIWVETVSKASQKDADAIAKFNSYVSEFKNLEKLYQSRFDACGDDMTIAKASNYMRLQRSGTEEDATLATETIEVKLN